MDDIMDFKHTLAAFRIRFDREIEKFFNQKIKEVRKKDIFIADSLEYVKKMTLAGGKRVRPALMYYGYIAAGGKEWKKMLLASMSVELIHMYLLIHDDIIDFGEKRHGVETLQVRYEKYAKRLHLNGSAKHFGESMAIIIGDMISALGNEVLYESKFDASYVMNALLQLQSVVSMTVVGQAQDILIEQKRKATEKEVLAMYENKTAKYTIEGPLHLGALLAGADKKFLDQLSKYAIPIGIAFQIQDDVLDIFGDQKKTGKTSATDIEGGKQTLLVIKAKEFASRQQRKALDDVLGKKNISQKEIDLFKNIVRETGSLDYAQKIAREMIEKGKEELEKINMQAESKRFLSGIADYMLNREV